MVRSSHKNMRLYLLTQTKTLINSVIKTHDPLPNGFKIGYQLSNSLVGKELFRQVLFFYLFSVDWSIVNHFLAVFEKQAARVTIIMKEVLLTKLVE